MENLLSDKTELILNQIKNSYDTNLNSVCTFCGSQIKQYMWVPHYKTCIPLAETHLKLVNSSNQSNIVKQKATTTTTTTATNKKKAIALSNIKIKQKQTNIPQTKTKTTTTPIISATTKTTKTTTNKPTTTTRTTKAKQQTTVTTPFLPTKSNSLVLSKIKEEKVDDIGNYIEEEEEEKKEILRIEAAPTVKSEHKRKREEIEQKELEDFRNQKLISNQLAIENQQKLDKQKIELCSIGNFAQCQINLRKKTDVFDYIVIEIGGTQINVCQINHFRNKYFSQKFISEYQKEQDTELDATCLCNSLSCTQNRINENKEFEFDCSNFISATSKINNNKQYFCSLDCLISLHKDKNSPLKNIISK